MTFLMYVASVVGFMVLIALGIVALVWVICFIGMIWSGVRRK